MFFFIVQVYCFANRLLIVLGSPLQKRQGSPGKSPPESHKDGKGLEYLPSESSFLKAEQMQFSTP